MAGGERSMAGPSGLLLAGGEALLGGLFAFREGGSRAMIVVAVFVGFCVTYLGVRLLVPIERRPIFAAHGRWSLAMTVVLGGPLAAGGLPHLGRVPIEDAVGVALLSGAGLYALAWFCT